MSIVPWKAAASSVASGTRALARLLDDALGIADAALRHALREQLAGLGIGDRDAHSAHARADELRVLREHAHRDVGGHCGRGKTRSERAAIINHVVALRRD